MRVKNGALSAQIQECARQIAFSEGIAALGMRRIAQDAGVSVGTVYNYFANKDEILLALAEEFWAETLLEMQRCINPGRFTDAVAQIYRFLREKMRDVRAGLMPLFRGGDDASLAEGRRRMHAMQQRLLAGLVQRLQSDPAIPAETWGGSFTPEAFALFVMANMLMLLQDGIDEMDFLTALIERTLYTNNREEPHHGTGTC